MPEEKNTKEEILPREIEEEMKESYLSYAMSVIIGRALPDARDGLKPVHRRILYSMYENGMLHNRPFKKSARIVGDTLGRYHPHGDVAIYDALVRLVQDFSMRYPLIQGQGNFGSVDGDSAAAMRYSEARLNIISEEMLTDIDKDTVDFVDNFDGSLQEPTVLPAKLPNLLINGSSGIAVGMATNIPPHNVVEIIDATIKIIDEPSVGIESLTKLVKGPDFPTGGIICGRNGVLNAYSTGRGKVVIRARYNMEEKGSRKSIIVTEIPYMVNKAEMIQEIASLVRDKKIVGISDIRDESDRDGMRVVIELKHDASEDVIVNQLYKQTRMQTTFGIIMLSLVGNRPRILNIKSMIECFIEHRKKVVIRRTKFELKKAEERAHILEGIIKALDNVDMAVTLIKTAKTVEEARASLISNFSISDIQANAILDLKLQKLATLEQDKIREERKGLLEQIANYSRILSSEQEIYSIIKNELNAMKEKYRDERRTQISEEEVTELEMEDLVEKSETAITVTSRGYIKRQGLDSYRQQKRGGMGIIATNAKEEDFVRDIFMANTHSYLLFFTDRGNVHWLKAYYLPEGGRQSGGKPIINLIGIEKEEKITAYIPINEFSSGKYLIMATRKGVIKKTSLDSYSRPRRGGIIAINLQQDDRLTDVKLTDGKQQIILATKKGIAIRFDENDVRPVGRNSMGVRGITLEEGDEVISMVLADETKTLLSITENGFGKRTNVSEYRLIGRAGKGVINIITSERNGDVVDVLSVDKEDFMTITRKGIVIRTGSNEIPLIGRNTQGVRIMRLHEGDKVVSMAKIVTEDGQE
ncbi:DNA gyrase subunit A [Candidatus Woesearchaeota archaeon]|nr:DNA gyrase subunit A [Candidatus Woesearchaeota archaeon]